MRAVVKDKCDARRVYENAKREGRAATLLEEDRPSLFTLSVANVAAGAVIEVELAYQEVVAYDDGHWRFVFPMVGPPRYRDDGAPDPAGVAPPRLPSGERPPDVALEIVLRDARSIAALRCASHRTEQVEAHDGDLHLRLPTDAPIPNRDFVLTWQAGGAGVRPLLRFEREAGAPGTFLLIVAPSSPRDSVERVGGRDAAPSVRCGNCGGVVTDLSDIKQIPGLVPWFYGMEG